MTRYVFSPHLGGWGHKVRSDTIATAIARRDPHAEITMLVRTDDPMPPELWTGFPYARTKISRSRAIIATDVFVQDGAWKYDRRVHALQLHGGRYIAVGQPYRIDMPPKAAHAVLSAAEKVIVPWPKLLFELDGILEDYRGRLANVEPILNIDGGRAAPDSEGGLVYLAISRGSTRVLECVRAGIAQAANRREDIRVAGGVGRFLPKAEHERLFGASKLVISQAPTAVFEAMGIGIPVIMLPMAGNEEHERLARDMRAHQAGIAIFDHELTTESVASAAESLLFDEDRRERAVGNERRLVPRSGLDEVVKLVMNGRRGRVA